jgi:hypothetical protein
MGTEREWKCRTANEEYSWKVAGNLEKRNGLAARVVDDDVSSRGCAAGAYGNGSKRQGAGADAGTREEWQRGEHRKEEREADENAHP